MENSATVVDAYRCLDCEAVRDETGGSLYECGNCGTVFTMESSADGGSNRCPQCGKFGAKLADDGCAECETGECEPVRAVEVDGDLVVVDEGLAPEQAAAQARERVAAEERRLAEAAEEKHRAEERRRAEFDALPRVRADEVLPGDVLGYHDPTSSWDKYPTFQVGRAAPDDAETGRIRLAPPGGMGLQFVCDPGDVFALVERPAETPENERSIEEALHDLDKGPVSRLG
jgi:DNA-directed RNA polymerase subunit RPC12/RpoP